MVSYQRWVTMAYLGLAVLAWLLFRQLTEVVWDLARFPIPENLPLSPAELIGLTTALILFVVLQRNVRINTFANEVAAELLKVTWAPRKETLVSTGVIAVVVGICSGILAMFDGVWGTLVKLWYR